MKKILKTLAFMGVAAAAGFAIAKYVCKSDECASYDYDDDLDDIDDIEDIRCDEEDE